MEGRGALAPAQLPHIQVLTLPGKAFNSSGSYFPPGWRTLKLYANGHVYLWVSGVFFWEENSQFFIISQRCP